MDVPFHIGYGGLICSKRLQSDRPKYSASMPDPRNAHNMIIKYLSVGHGSWFWNQQVTLNVLFQMRYDSMHKSKRQPSDRQRAETPPVFSPLKACFPYCLHSDALLTSASIPLHFGLSLSNPLEQINLPYINWKRTFIAFIWGMAAWFATTGLTVTTVVPF